MFTLRHSPLVRPGEHGNSLYSSTSRRNQIIYFPPGSPDAAQFNFMERASYSKLNLVCSACHVVSNYTESLTPLLITCTPLWILITDEIKQLYLKFIGSEIMLL